MLHISQLKRLPSHSVTESDISKCSSSQLLSLSVVQLALDSTHIPTRRVVSTRNLFIPPINPLDCRDLHNFLCYVTRCSSLPQDFCLKVLITSAEDGDKMLMAAVKQWGWFGGVWWLCEELACSFSGGGQQCSKLVVLALLLAAFHTHTQFLPWCCLPDGKKWLGSSRKFNETQITNSRSCCCSNAALWWWHASVKPLWRTLTHRRYRWPCVYSHPAMHNVP